MVFGLPGYLNESFSVKLDIVLVGFFSFSSGLFFFLMVDLTSRGKMLIHDHFSGNFMNGFTPKMRVKRSMFFLECGNVEGIYP